MARSLLLASAAALLALPAGAHAQILSVYVQSANTHFSNVETGTVYSSGSGYTNQYTSFFSSGVGGGVTLNFLPIGPVKLGFDLRGSTHPGTPGFDTAMGGLRIAFKAPFIKPKPYLQASAGYVSARSTNVSSLAGGTGTVGGTFENKYVAWSIFGGVDIPLIPFLDFRVEVGGGQALNTGFSFSNTNNQNATLFSVNPGLVAHF